MRKAILTVGLLALLLSACGRISVSIEPPSSEVPEVTTTTVVAAPPATTEAYRNLRENPEPGTPAAEGGVRVYTQAWLPEEFALIESLDRYSRTKSYLTLFDISQDWGIVSEGYTVCDGLDQGYSPNQVHAYMMEQVYLIYEGTPLDTNDLDDIFVFVSLSVSTLCPWHVSMIEGWGA